MPFLVTIRAEIILWPFIGIVTEDSFWSPMMEFGVPVTADDTAVGAFGHEDWDLVYLGLGKMISYDFGGDEVRAAAWVFS